MAAQGRTAEYPLNQWLFEKGKGFSFFQLVQLLERCYDQAARVGRQGPASREVLRFRPQASLAFPVSDIAGIESLPETEDQIPRILVTTTFLGLYGTTSPLPLFYTEEILWSEDDKVRAFMDLFHHRFLSLFYRCWLKYRYHMQFDRRGNDDFSQRMFGMIGLGTEGVTEHTGIPAIRLIRFAGLLTQQPRSAAALEGMLSDFFFNVPVHIEPFTGRWAVVKSEQLSALGLGNCSLGLDCTLGGRVYSRSNSFRISVGPLDYETFEGFLPDGENFRMLGSIVKLFVKDRLDFDIELRVRGREIPGMKLVSTGQARLGWTAWLYTEGSQEVREESLLLRGNS